MEYDYMDSIMSTGCVRVDGTVNYCYSFESLSDEGEEKDQVGPKVLVL